MGRRPPRTPRAAFRGATDVPAWWSFYVSASFSSRCAAAFSRWIFCSCVRMRRLSKSTVSVTFPKCSHRPALNPKHFGRWQAASSLIRGSVRPAEIGATFFAVSYEPSPTCSSATTLDMPHDAYWSVAIVVCWAIVLLLRGTLFLIRRLSTTQLPGDAFFLFGIVERLLLLVTVSYALWFYSPRIYAGACMAWALAQDTSNSSNATLYYHIALLASVCLYWAVALLFNLPGVPIALNRRVFWPLQALLLLFAPALFLGGLAFLYAIIPIGVLWWFTIYDQAHATVA